MFLEVDCGIKVIRIRQRASDSLQNLEPLTLHRCRSPLSNPQNQTGRTPSVLGSTARVQDWKFRRLGFGVLLQQGLGVGFRVGGAGFGFQGSELSV